MKTKLIIAGILGFIFLHIIDFVYFKNEKFSPFDDVNYLDQQISLKPVIVDKEVSK